MAGDRVRVVLDTNIVISSLWGGHPGRIMDLWKNSRFHLLISGPILREYLDVLARFGLTEEQVKERGLLFVESPCSIWVRPTRSASVVTEDPSDNRFLECAIAGDADFIVSGDHHLLSIKRFHGIPIIKAKEFLSRIETPAHKN